MGGIEADHALTVGAEGVHLCTVINVECAVGFYSSLMAPWRSNRRQGSGNRKRYERYMPKYRWEQRSRSEDDRRLRGKLRGEDAVNR